MVFLINSLSIFEKNCGKRLRFRGKYGTLRPLAGVVELADAPDSKS